MRALVVLAAIVFKIWFVVRMMTPQDIILLRIAAFGLVVLMLTIMGGCTPQKPKRFHEVICFDPAQRSPFNDYDLCEFKLRSASGAYRPNEAYIG